MNKTIKIMAALLPLFITSCTNDDANVTTTPQQDQVVTLSAGITRAEGETGTTTTAPFSYDKIKVINVTRQGKGLPYSQAVFTKNTSEATTAWTMSEGTLLWCAGEKNTFRAVYPATADFSSFTVPADQSTEDKLNSADWMVDQPDPLYYPNINDKDQTFPTIAFNLTRKMAMVVVEITGEAQVNTFSSLVVESPSSDNTNITFDNQDKKITAYSASDNDNKFYAIIPPGSKGSEAILCYLTLNGSDEKKLKLGNNIQFLAGKKYTFTAYISDTSSPSGGAATRSAAPGNLTLVSVEPM